ncbi:dephospho-CoA kinase [Candidatus Woesearchaeota archaeon]|nr:dephospho-CoA kinase [Candidatus Woesearchaeota archaeon]
MIIGVTGSFASGKTTAANMFRELGYSVIDADKIGHDILKKEAYGKVVKAFGKEILKKNKQINRKNLGNRVFNDKNQLKKLNKITHPIIFKKIRERIKKIKSKKIIIDAAVLIEAKWYKVCDKVVVIKINKSNQLKRAKNKEYAESIIKNQLPQNKKLKYADFVVDNNKSLNNARKQIIGILESFN